MARSHLYRPLTDSEGNLLESGTVTVFMSDSIGLIYQPMFTTDDGTDYFENPFEITEGILDLWLDLPQRVVIQVSSEGFGGVDLFLKVDVLPPPPEIVTVTGGVLRIINTPEPGYVLCATDTAGEAEWRDFTPTPVVTDINPTSAASGALFTITGTGFVAGSELAGSAGGANFTLVNSTTITVNLSGAPDDYDVGITSENGMSNLLPVTLT